MDGEMDPMMGEEMMDEKPMEEMMEDEESVDEMKEKLEDGAFMICCCLCQCSD
jgi:hypothetical protein